jgi:hypothetical protein
LGLRSKVVEQIWAVRKAFAQFLRIWADNVYPEPGNLNSTIYMGTYYPVTGGDYTVSTSNTPTKYVQ